MAKLTVNGEQRSYDGDPSMPLLWVCATNLALTGTKFGCGVALCGACTVHLDGEAVRSCIMPMSRRGRQARSSRSRGSIPKGKHPVQRAWREISVPQCGYCQAGQIMQAAALLAAEAEAHRRGDHRAPWPATSAAAAAISASHAAVRAGRDGSVTMTTSRTHQRSPIANVSRRVRAEGHGRDRRAGARRQILPRRRRWPPMPPAPARCRAARSTTRTSSSSIDPTAS